ncbi:zinc finger, C3HC4 type [Ancylostoma duodenale]|uniref:Zinc finger, C3HC4 type n=1 Tax=Ancylostoma duodenale TaxID=51022 RepID=A0A0C2GVI7_9BILA|nr:zinc finger, C3HC4 type [Ancylostoma duodenale]
MMPFMPSTYNITCPNAVTGITQLRAVDPVGPCSPSRRSARTPAPGLGHPGIEKGRVTVILLQSNIINRPKRRRTDNFATDDEDETKPGVSTETASTSAAAHADDDSGDDGCTICYEEYTSAGDHRLASVKCGHFFGYSCIARWIRSEGRNAVCPTCKAKATIKDVRKHYTNAVKVTDTTEVEMLRNSNAALHIKISGLEVELARKDREITDLMKRIQEGKPQYVHLVYHLLVKL